MAGALAAFWASTYGERAPEYFVKKSWSLDPFSESELIRALDKEAYINIGRFLRISLGLSHRCDIDPARVVPEKSFGLRDVIRDEIEGFKAMGRGEYQRTSYDGFIGKAVRKRWQGFLLRNFSIVSEPYKPRNFRLTQHDANIYIEPFLASLKRKMHVTAIEYAKPVIKPEPVPLMYKWFGNDRQKTPYQRPVKFEECYMKAKDVLVTAIESGLPDGGEHHEAYSRGNVFEEEGYDYEKQGEMFVPLNYKRAVLIALLLCDDRTAHIRKMESKEACVINKPRMS